MKKILFLMCIVISLLTIPLAVADHSTLIGTDGRITDTAGNNISNANITVNISTSNSCAADVIYSKHFVDNATQGIFGLTLGISDELNMSYNKDYYICYTINGNNTFGANRFRGGQGQIDSEDLNPTGEYNISTLGATGNITANWFLGFFNGTYYGDGTNLVTSTTYLPSLVLNGSGTVDGGNITSLWTMKDGNIYNVSEASGASPLTIYINFTNVSDFDQLILRERYSGGAGHEIDIGFWDYGASAWEYEYGDITDMDDFAISVTPIIDSSDHIQNGVVQLILNHQQPGIITHDFFLDYAVLVDGISFLSTNTHDGLSGRDSLDNHPWAFAINGTRAMTGDLNMSTNNIVSQGNITNPYNSSWGYFNNGTCIVIGDLQYVSEC